MYKKRLARWGLKKNSRCSEKGVSILATKKDTRSRPSRKKCNAIEELGSIPVALQPGHDDSLMLTFLSSVRRWNLAFFESVYPYNGDLRTHRQGAQAEQLCSEKAKDTSFTLKLVGDLLDRGHGTLAGKMVRKAFLLVEDILSLEGPVLVWNLLDIMHHMVTLRHGQLFHILLAHLIGLVNGRMSKAHPLSVMLHKLRRLVASLTTAALTPGGSALRSSSLSTPFASTDGNSTTTFFQPSLFFNIILSLLERAWTLNAEIVFNHFDSYFFPLYFQLHWESCSIVLPPAFIGTTKQWLEHMQTQLMYNVITDARCAEGVVGSLHVEEDRMLQSLHAPRMDSSPSLDYEMLQANSVAALLELGYPVLSHGIVSNSDTATTLRSLPALIKARILKQSAAVFESSRTSGGNDTSVSRAQAGDLACVTRALMELNAQNDGKRIEALPGAVDRIQSLIALRQYASSDIDPQVIREMWLLEDALAVAGEHGKAQEVNQSVICRLEKYTLEVALDCA